MVTLGATMLLSALGAMLTPDPPVAVAAQDGTSLVTLDQQALHAWMMRWWNPQTGRWTGGNSEWWTTPVDMVTLMDADRTLGRPAPVAELADMYRNSGLEGPGFTNQYNDDSLWWGRAWLTAFGEVRDVRYLAAAEQVADTVWKRRSTACGGGIPWAVGIDGGDEQNAITNALFIELTAHLYGVTHESRYRVWSATIASWFVNSGLIARGYRVVDHLDASCQPTGLVWSYSQGETASAMLAVGYLTLARQVGDALAGNTMLVDPCEPNMCGEDGDAFKGIAVSELVTLDQTFPDHPYAGTLIRWADTATMLDQGTEHQYGLDWNGPLAEANASRQASAVALLTGAIEVSS